MMKVATTPLTTGEPRRILITGASRGIGRATALALARRGEHLILAARSLDLLQETAAAAVSGGAASAEAIAIDVTDDASVEAGCQRILSAGPVDVLLNNAGVCEQALFLTRSIASCEYEMAVNYFGAQRMARALLPSMLERGRGSILNVSSLLGAVACPTTANYSGTKAALNAWSHALRGEVADRGVHVGVFMPSHTQGGIDARFEVAALPLEYVVSQLLHALDHAPRSYAASPVYRGFLWLAGLFPAWAERQVARSTRALYA